MQIYVSFKRPRTVQEFIKQFFSGPRGMWGGCSVSTYYDKSCTSLHCSVGRARSWQDLYDCVKTYFPSVTQKKVLSEFLKFKMPGMYFRPYHCGTIKRPVISFNTQPVVGLIVPTPAWAENGIGWRQILSLRNINTAVEMYDYQK
jgi:hypothetical protein